MVLIPGVQEIAQGLQHVHVIIVTLQQVLHHQNRLHTQNVSREGPGLLEGGENQCVTAPVFL